MGGSKLDRRGVPDSLGGSGDIPQEGRRTIKVNRGGGKQSLVAKRGVKGTKEEKEQEKKDHIESTTW